MKQEFVRFVSAAALVLNSACGENTSPVGTTEGVVRGTVTHGAGAPVSGADVSVFAFEAACGTPLQAHALSRATTSAGGAFSVIVGSHILVGEICVSVRVTPGTSSGLADTTVSNLYVRVAKPGPSVVIDTLTVSISLRSL